MAIYNIRTGFDGDNPSCSVEIADAAGNNRKLVAMITQERTPASITAPTFNSVTGTLVASISETGSTNNLHILVYEWNDSGTNGIASLPSSAGTYTLLTGGISAEIAVSGISCSGAKQTACVVPSPATVSGLSNADDPSFTISAASGSLALMCIVDNNSSQTLTKGANQVDILASTSSGNARHASSYNATDSTVSYTRTTTTNYAAAACAIEPAPAGGLSITSIVPTSFDTGKSVTVNGSGFGSSQGSSTLTIGGEAQTVTSWSDNEIVFTSVRGSASMGATTVRLVKA